MSPATESPPPLSKTRRIGASIRRRFGRIRHTKSSSSDSSTPRSSISSSDDAVPKELQDGIYLTKISTKKQRKLLFRLDPESGQLIWESKVKKYIPIVGVRDLRTGLEAKNYREQFQPPNEDYEDRWLTIIYIINSDYKAMHLLAPTKELMEMWIAALRRLYVREAELMSGLGQGELLDAAWERHYWNGRGFTFQDVERLCRKLSINHAGDGELRRLFEQANPRRHDCLDYEDFRRFVKILKARPDIDRLYKKLIRKHGRFDFDVFQNFMRDAQRSTLGTADLQALFNAYASCAAACSPSTPSTTPPVIMPLESFASFLVSIDNPAFLDCEEGPHKHHHTHHSPSPKSIHVEAAINERKLGAGHDMTRPLSEYFISSSHNTYLVGHQLVGESTVEGYVRALQAGCRCVELDIHPGNPTPLITHGKTLTSKIELRKVCEIIDRYAFSASPYPLIISAEIHCGPAQQDMVVEIMKDVFGEKLVQAPVGGRPPIDELPSPHDLRGMILVKAKNLYVSRDAGVVGGANEAPGTGDAPSYTSADSTAEESERGSRTEDGKSSSAPSMLLQAAAIPRIHTTPPAEPKREQPLLQKASAAIQRVRSRSRAHSNSQSSESSPPSAFVPLGPRANSDSAKPKMSFALLALLVYTVGVKYRGINKKEVYAPQHMFSLSENTANKMLRSGAVLDVIKHSRTHLVRLYPKGTRLKSSNYLPHNYWSAGAQLVAINWQTLDLGYMMNHAMFQRNGGLGYVLKPRALRLPNQKDLLAQRTEHVFEVGIISAQQLLPPRDCVGPDRGTAALTVDPYVEVSVHAPDWTGFLPPHAGWGAGAVGPPALAVPPLSPAVTYRTSAVKNNVFNPVWEEKLRIPFSVVGDMTELVFVRFAVRQDGSKDDDEPLAVYCAPLACLQHGYRHLRLHDTQLSPYMFSTLFVKIAVRDL